MNIRAWSISLLLFLSTVTAVGQTANRYLKAPLPNGWEENGEVFLQTLPVDDHWWKSFGDSNRGCSNCWLATRICVIIIYEYKRKCTK